MINQRNPQQIQVVREFSSEFDTGECWGYNKFFKIENLIPEGYLIPEKDIIELKYFVRASTYQQNCQDLELHINNIEKIMKNQAEELQFLKEQLKINDINLSQQQINNDQNQNQKQNYSQNDDQDQDNEQNNANNEKFDKFKQKEHLLYNDASVHSSFNDPDNYNMNQQDNLLEKAFSKLKHELNIADSFCSSQYEDQQIQQMDIFNEIQDFDVQQKSPQDIFSNKTEIFQHQEYRKPDEFIKQKIIKNDPPFLTKEYRESNQEFINKFYNYNKNNQNDHVDFLENDLINMLNHELQMQEINQINQYYESSSSQSGEIQMNSYKQSSQHITNEYHKSSSEKNFETSQNQMESSSPKPYVRNLIKNFNEESPQINKKQEIQTLKLPQSLVKKLRAIQMNQKNKNIFLLGNLHSEKNEKSN